MAAVLLVDTGFLGAEPPSSAPRNPAGLPPTPTRIGAVEKFRDTPGPGLLAPEIPR